MALGITDGEKDIDPRILAKTQLLCCELDIS